MVQCVKISFIFLYKKKRTTPHTAFAYDHKTSVSYFPKKGKIVILLFTMHTYGEVDQVKQMPEVVLYYNPTKGVYTHDQLC